MPAIHWFRRDLRITDNTALTAACRNAETVIPVYIASEWRGKHRWNGAARQEFLCGCVASLSKNISSIGGQLIIRRGCAVEELERLAIETKASAIYFNRAPDPFGRAMEERLEKMARRLGLEVHGFKDTAIHERSEILTSTGGPYRVFTPYFNAWMQAEKPPVQVAIRRLRTPAHIESLPLPVPEDWGLKSTASIPETGEKAARKRLAEFLRGPVLVYGANRDVPFGRNTSCLSADLRHGTLSIREIHAKCAGLAKEAAAAERKSIFTFIKELAWREFYMQILWHFPEVLEHEFNPKHRGLKWRKAGADFQRWCDGETGFPIVDAGMRQLNATGFMHNRLRMITAMFLTKDLHIDWRHGERYFMQKLIDGEIASNNGGWQWSAGTGADAAPYFRIQNPWSQSARFDAEGKYIKHWVPELRDVDSAQLAKAPAGEGSLAKNYPLPMVDHAAERNVTLEMFAQAVPEKIASGNLMNYSITRLLSLCGLFLCLGCVVMAEPGAAEYASEVQVTPLLHTTTTVTGQPIEYPKTDKPLVTTVLVEIPPGKETGWHTHPMPCFAYILQGTITVEVEGGKTLTYHAGQAIAETVNTPHNGRNLGTETVKIIMTVMGEQGIPIAKHLDKK